MEPTAPPGRIWRLVPAMVSVSASTEQLGLGSGRVLWRGDVWIGPRLSWVELAVFVFCGTPVWSEPVGGKYSALAQQNGCMLELLRSDWQSLKERLDLFSAGVYFTLCFHEF